MRRGEPVVQQVLALPLLRQHLRYLGHQIGGPNQLTQTYIGMRGFHEFGQFTARLRQHRDTAERRALARRVDGLLDVVRESVVPGLGLAGGDLERDRVEARVVTGCVAAHHRGDVPCCADHDSPHPRWPWASHRLHLPARIRRLRLGRPRDRGDRRFHPPTHWETSP